MPVLSSRWVAGVRWFASGLCLLVLGMGPVASAPQPAVSPSTLQALREGLRNRAPPPTPPPASEVAPAPSDSDAPQTSPASPHTTSAAPHLTQPAIAPDGQSPSGIPLGSPAKLRGLGDKLTKVLAAYHHRRLSTVEHSPWEMMHGIIAYGEHTEILRGGARGKPVNGMSWLCNNGLCKGQRILEVNRGRITALKGVGVQGHHGQLLAILAQSDVPTDYPLRVGEREFTVADLIETEKLTCEPKSELTFKLISLMHYLPSDAQWKSDAGQAWDLSRLIREEIAQPIRGAACGGTHRLMGLSHAAKLRAERGEPLDGEFARARHYINDYHQYAFSLQNADGSFSTEWFVRKGARPDLARRLQTTGHILEWLAFSLSDEELRDPRVVRAVDYLATIMSKDSQTWEVGPLGHAVHALALYNQRVFGRPAVDRPPLVAERPEMPKTTSRPVAARPVVPPRAKQNENPEASRPRGAKSVPEASEADSADATSDAASDLDLAVVSDELTDVKTQSSQPETSPADAPVRDQPRDDAIQGPRLSWP